MTSDEAFIQTLPQQYVEEANALRERAAHARARHLAAALGCPLPGGGALAAPALLLLECELLPLHARRQLPPPFWVGSAALPLLRGDLAWLDTEAP